MKVILNSQHLTKVLILLQIIHQKKASKQAFIASNTACGKRLTASGMGRSGPKNIFLESLCRKLGVDLDIGENSGCEKFRNRTGLDLYFSGQSIYIVERYQGKYVLFEYYPCVGDKAFRKRQCPYVHWKDVEELNDEILWLDEDANEQTSLLSQFKLRLKKKK